MTYTVIQLLALVTVTVITADASLVHSISFCFLFLYLCMVYFSKSEGMYFHTAALTAKVFKSITFLYKY